MVTPFFHALCFLCALGAVVMAAASVGDAGRQSMWRPMLLLAAGFAAAVIWVRPERLPETVTVATLSACVATWQLVRPQYTFLPALFGGALAGASAVLIHVYGLPMWMALPLAALSPAIAVMFTARRRYFAPAGLKEEALLGLMAFSLLLAAAPVLLAGWQSASALNLADQAYVNFALPLWPLALASVPMFLGGAYAAWRRR